jgi:hypothetical protein
LLRKVARYFVTISSVALPGAGKLTTARKQALHAMICNAGCWRWAFTAKPGMHGTNGEIAVVVMRWGRYRLDPAVGHALPYAH